MNKTVCKINVSNANINVYINNIFKIKYEQ